MRHALSTDLEITHAMTVKQDPVDNSIVCLRHTHRLRSCDRYAPHEFGLWQRFSQCHDQIRRKQFARCAEMDDGRIKLPCHPFDSGDIGGEKQRGKYGWRPDHLHNGCRLLNRKLPREGTIAYEHADMIHADRRYCVGFRRCCNFVNLRQHCLIPALPANHLNNQDGLVFGQWPVWLNSAC
ncbi:hypothetical protein SAMN05216330_12716 [Bradyrhizobium sp. Ghvi]|nr:hypothetical protein SAMN05216330_12716 [Bradyrhizobium sp. Ghvi]